MDARGQIENLLAQYCRYYDDGDLHSYADLFKHATISGMSSHDEIVKWHSENINFYDGEPRTRHVTTNVEIHVDEEAGTATAKSYITCYQALPDFPLQPCFIGSYFDKFHRIEGQWYFADRQFKMHLIGDGSRHPKPRFNADGTSANNWKAGYLKEDRGPWRPE